MKSIGIYILFLFVMFGINSAWAVVAFPGAEGFGKDAVGGRGGQVIEVTNLSDSGTGSLRAAVEASGPRIVVFRISGTIEMQSELRISKPYITIAGQTAPGDGICLKNYRFKIEANDVIVRYMRFRLGDNAVVEHDTVWVNEGHNIIIDHCSASWSVDETLSVAEPGDSELDDLGNVTIQWCMITESLNCSIHSKGCHGYGSLVRGAGGNGITYHHNLYAHHAGRNPRPGNYHSYTADPGGLIFDFRNNVIYNWGGSRAGNNDDQQNGVLSITRMNFVGNYYKRGFNSTGNYAFKETTTTSRAYFSGNWMSSLGGYPPDPWTLVQFSGSWWTPALIAAYKQSSPIPVASVYTDDAVTAYGLVLADVGTSFPVRDSVDERIVNDVINGTGHIINDESEVGGWPELQSSTPPTDTDHDGMPDEWEFTHCLDPYDPNDCNSDRDGDGYTNIEEYINWLPLGEPMPPRADVNCDNIVNLYDFSEFAERWSSSYGGPLYNEKYDFNNDGVISFADLSYIAADWLWYSQD